MKKGTKISPIQPRTPEQLERDWEVARKRKIVVDNFYPALIAATTSVDEARMLIQAATSLIMEEVMNTMRERKFEDIYNRILKKLSPDGVRQLEIEKLLDTVKGENLFVAREIIEGMNRAIEQMVQDDMRGRRLDSLKADWDKMLN